MKSLVTAFSLLFVTLENKESICISTMCDSNNAKQLRTNYYYCYLYSEVIALSIIWFLKEHFIPYMAYFCIYTLRGECHLMWEAGLLLNMALPYQVPPLFPVIYRITYPVLWGHHTMHFLTPAPHCWNCLLAGDGEMQTTMSYHRVTVPTHWHRDAIFNTTCNLALRASVPWGAEHSAVL